MERVEVTPEAAALLKEAAAVDCAEVADNDPRNILKLIQALAQSLRAALAREAEMQQALERLKVEIDAQKNRANQNAIRAVDAATCEHCDLPMVCASAQAERIHGLEVMHAEALTRAEQAERERDTLAARGKP